MDEKGGGIWDQSLLFNIGNKVILTITDDCDLILGETIENHMEYTFVS